MGQISPGAAPFFLLWSFFVVNEDLVGTRFELAHALQFHALV